MLHFCKGVSIKFCNHILLADEQWWKVTFAEDESIQAVALFNRVDGRRDRLSNVVVTLLSEHDTVLASYTFGSLGDNDLYFRIPASTFSVPDGKLDDFSRSNLSWVYQGCFLNRDSGSSLSTQVTSISVTKGSCSDECSKRNFNFFGLQNGYQCFCGNVLTSKADRRYDINCVRRCNANRNDFCGGDGYNAVYMIVSSNGMDLIF